MISRIWLAVIGIFALTACNPMENLEESEGQIAQFERAYSSGNADRLWRLTGDELKQATPRNDFDDLLEVFQARLGKITSSERSSFNLNTNNGVTQTVIVMDTEFEQAEGTQTYTFRGNGEDMELVGWHVDSPRLAVTIEDLSAAQEREEQSADAE